MNVIADKESGTLRLPHRVDETTGMYRGKQIAPAKEVRAPRAKAKGPSTEPAGEHTHEHAHVEHTNADVKSSKGVSGKVATGGRPKARSGMGGGV